MAEMRPRAVTGQGIDESMVVRPGVPRERPPLPASGAHWEEPERQLAGRDALDRLGIAVPAAVFGTGEPPRLLSGVLRRLAYRIPEHRTGRWALLLAADRVDVVEHGLERGWPLIIALTAAGASYVLVMRSLRRRAT